MRSAARQPVAPRIAARKRGRPAHLAAVRAAREARRVSGAEMDATVRSDLRRASTRCQGAGLGEAWALSVGEGSGLAMGVGAAVGMGPSNGGKTTGMGRP